MRARSSQIRRRNIHRRACQGHSEVDRAGRRRIIGRSACGGPNQDFSCVRERALLSSVSIIGFWITRCFDILCVLRWALHKSSFCFSCDSTIYTHDNTMTFLVVPMSLINIAGFLPLGEFKQRQFSPHDVRRLSQTPKTTCVGGKCGG